MAGINRNVEEYGKKGDGYSGIVSTMTRATVDPHEAKFRKIIEIWQPYSKEPLTHTDAVEICWSVNKFFAVMKRIAERQNNSNQGCEVALHD